MPRNLPSPHNMLKNLSNHVIQHWAQLYSEGQGSIYSNSSSAESTSGNTSLPVTFISINPSLLKS